MEESKKKIEIQVKKQIQVEHELIGHIIPHINHQIFEINNETKEIELAEYIPEPTFVIGQKNNKKLLVRNGFSYVSALNKTNALKKFEKNSNGSKQFSENPIKLTVF